MERLPLTFYKPMINKKDCTCAFCHPNIDKLRKKTVSRMFTCISCGCTQLIQSQKSTTQLNKTLSK